MMEFYDDEMETPLPSFPNSDGYFYYYRPSWPARARVEVVRGRGGLAVRVKDDAPLIPIENFPTDCEWTLTNPGPLGVLTDDDDFIVLRRHSDSKPKLEKTLRQQRWEQYVNGPLTQEFDAIFNELPCDASFMDKMGCLLKAVGHILKTTAKQYD
jgi:hypothetical protein